jgi:hypothetical protein
MYGSNTIFGGKQSEKTALPYAEGGRNVIFRNFGNHEYLSIAKV